MGYLLAVLFTVTLNLQYWNRYPAFINTIRSKPELRGGTTHGLPILPQQTVPPTRFFDVDLVFGNSRITARIRGDNLYLVGYKAASTAPWLEFGRRATTPTHLIPGSTFLEFGGDYGDLERVASTSRQSTPLGRGPLQKVVTDLDRPASATTQQAKARALLVLIQMLSEAIRFRAISEPVANYTTGTVPTTAMVTIENNWSALSDALLLQDRCSTCPFPIRTPNAMNISSYADAVKALGMVLRTRTLQYQVGFVLPTADAAVEVDDGGKFQAHDTYESSVEKVAGESGDVEEEMSSI